MEVPTCTTRLLGTITPLLVVLSDGNFTVASPEKCVHIPDRMKDLCQVSTCPVSIAITLHCMHIWNIQTKRLPKQCNTTQCNSPKTVIFQRKNELPQAGFEPVRSNALPTELLRQLSWLGQITHTKQRNTRQSIST